MKRILLVFGLGLVFTLAACASSPEPAPEPAPAPPPRAQAPPPPPPEPEPAPVADVEPRRPVLPKTASSLPALGLAGVVALGAAGALHVARRRLERR